MIINDFKAYDGEHCETTAIGSLLQHEGLRLSEPMLFGLSSGLGFIYWNMKSMPMPFIGGRTKNLLDKLCDNLSISADVKETASVKKAWSHVKVALEGNKAVGL
ncbi:MAG: BtrH N-terminal domain-containing protein, partial [Lentisphaeraceae bacterium]|nr:BtrH N-terminal domain-containing protein [Lentisphaeraceae bacterium]